MKSVLFRVCPETLRQSISRQFVDMATLSTYRENHWTMIVLMAAATQVRVDRLQSMHLPRIYQSL
jgi:hypothetical protein